MKIQINSNCILSTAWTFNKYLTESSFYCMFNSLRPSDAIWRQWSWTTLAQVMACCLTAPSHYLKQCWLIIRGVLWHTSESSFAGIAQGIDSGYEFEKDILKNIFKSPRGQWVKPWWVTDCFCKTLSTSDNIVGLAQKREQLQCIMQWSFISATQTHWDWSALILCILHIWSAQYSILWIQYSKSWINLKLKLVWQFSWRAAVSGHDAQEALHFIHFVWTEF